MINLDLKPCPHCGGKKFDQVPGDYGIGKLNDPGLMLPVKITACVSCGHLAIMHDKSKS